MSTDNIKHAVDAVSVSTTLAVLAGWLPYMAAFASLVWSCIRIYETKTVQGWLGRLSPPQAKEEI